MDQTEAQSAGKNFFRQPPPPPPLRLSKGLDLPVQNEFLKYICRLSLSKNG